MKVYRSVARIKAIEPSHVGEGYWHRDQGNITVYADDTARDTGLLDVRGNPIISREEIGPIGFNK